MATTTTNFGFDVPTSSDLVKNGATQIALLGQDIDTFLAGGVGFSAGKNKIINGDFSVNQRAFTTTTTNGTFGFDRWSLALSGGTATYSAQTFTAGTAPVAGYEAKNFARLVTTVGNDGCRLQQFIEDVRTFAGQTVKISFWAKGTNPTTAGNLAVNFSQEFGTGGSPSSSVAVAQQTFVLTANWTRYTFTMAIPSISGKTIGTAGNSYLALFIGQGSSVATDSWTLDLWGVQVEAGSTATPFTTASGGSQQGELAMCQRYYYRQTVPIISNALGNGMVDSTTIALIKSIFPVTMRVYPTALEQTGTATDYAVRTTAATSTVCSAVPAYSNASTTEALTTFTVASGLVGGQAAIGRAATTSAYLGWSAEL